MRIQDFIGEVKMREREMRERIVKEQGPLVEAKVRKYLVACKLDYASGNPPHCQLELRTMLKEECRGERDWQEHCEVARFLAELRWDHHEPEQGGVSWLELALLYKRMAAKEPSTSVHSGCDGLSGSVENQVAAFKRITRKVVFRRVKEEQESKLLSAKVARNRLGPLMVSNKHALVRGMPLVSRGDAEAIAAAIVAMRGAVTRKQMDQLKGGNLKLNNRPLSLRSVKGNWEDVLLSNIKGERNQPSGQLPFIRSCRKGLDIVCCPDCGAVKEVWDRDWFINKFPSVRCLACIGINNARRWRCECGLLVHKCPVHFGKVARTVVKPGTLFRRRKKKLSHKVLQYGVGEPLPRVKQPEVGTLVRSRPFLRPGTRLADKFPWLVKWSY